MKTMFYPKCLRQQLYRKKWKSGWRLLSPNQLQPQKDAAKINRNFELLLMQYAQVSQSTSKCINVTHTTKKETQWLDKHMKQWMSLYFTLFLSVPASSRIYRRLCAATFLQIPSNIAHILKVNAFSLSPRDNSSLSSARQMTFHTERGLVQFICSLFWCSVDFALTVIALIFH